MKNLAIFLGTFLGCCTLPMLFANSTPNASNVEEKQDTQMKHGKKGKDGRSGENGENGENGQNGGNGGKGGNGGASWWQGGNGGNGGSGGISVDSSNNASTKQSSELVDEWEYTALKAICKQLVLTTISKFYDPLDSACLATCKQSISTYLCQVGTATAKKILEEYENVQWGYPAILNV